MVAKRNRNTVNIWRCEEANREGWRTRVCRELLELGKPTSCCKTNLCTRMQERLEQHRLNCPASHFDDGPSRERTLNARPQVKRISDQTSFTARKSSVGVTARRISSAKRKSKSHSAQARFTFSDNITTVEAPEEHSAQTNFTFNRNTDPGQNKEANEAEKDKNCDDIVPFKPKTSETIYNRIPSKPCDINHISLRSNGYREGLHVVIHEFFHDIPVFPNTSEKLKHKRLNIIDNFVDKIADLFVFFNERDYYDKLAQDIDECLRVLPMWEPQSKQANNDFKNCLKDTLFTLIKSINENWHTINETKENYSRSIIPSAQNKRNENMEKEINNWVENNLKTNNTKVVRTKKLIKKIKAILECGKKEKRVIKAEIVNILQDISPYMEFPQDKDAYINTLASDLTNMLSKLDDKYNFNVAYKQQKDNEANDYRLVDKIEDDAISQITDALFRYDDLALYDNRRDSVKKIHRIHKSSCKFSDSKASSVANTLITNRNYHKENVYKTKNKGSRSSSFVVLTSEQDLSNKTPPFHSTPNERREIPTLNKAEQIFTEKVKSIIRAWLHNTDASFETTEEQKYKETVVNDITNDVHTVVKEVVQLQIPGGLRGAEEKIHEIILKGIRKYGLFTQPMTDGSPQVVDLRRRILALDTDDLLDKSALLEPQHGNRQAMANIKFRNIEGWNKEHQEYYQPKALEILEDNISVWMNEQPSDIYKPLDKPTRNQLLRELATNIQEKTGRRKSDRTVKKELKQWLKKIVTPQMQRNVDGLAESLKNRITKLPQDETLGRTHKKRMNVSKEAPVHFTESIEHSYELTETDKQLNEFIDAYIRKNNMSDDVVNGVLKLMLRREIHKLSTSTREELYNNESNAVFNNDEFHLELKIAKIVHDWLKNIPFYYQLLKPGPEVTEFVHTLARNITDIEMERAEHPDKMDYTSWLRNDIETYMLEKYNEIANDEDRRTLGYHAGQLCLQISHLRNHDDKDELSKMINQHMDRYNAILTKDYLKKLLWHRRILDQLRKLQLTKPEFSRAHVEEALAIIPLPRDDSVIKFKLELKYNVTIHDWLHGLPVVPTKNSEEEHIRKNKMQELLQKVIETEERKAENPSDTQADDDLENYIAVWISELQFEKGANVNVPALISQLRSGLEFVKWAQKQAQAPQQFSAHGLNRHSKQTKSNDPKQDPGEQMVETIENWCNNLPINEANDEVTNAIKKQVATNIFQIVGSLNGDPRFANDNEKLKNTLSNEIEEQLQNLADHKSVSENKERLKDELVKKIMEINTLIHDVTAGDDYVQELENSIDAALPNAVHRSPKHDPAYELYKKRVVMLWLLENYDYAVDFHSLKYKKILSEEIDSLSEEIQKRNNLPADKDEIMNEIKSVFYSTSPPSEDVIVDEIEHIKLRCEIELWANELPIMEAVNFNKVLERNQILTILSKMLFFIERQDESDANEKMKLEINKWTEKLPLIWGENKNIPKYSELLMCLLKASADSRKCQRHAESENLNVAEETLSKLKSDDKGISKANKGPIAGPSCGACDGCGASLENLEFLTNKTISDWCAQLPLRFGVADENNVVKRTKLFTVQRLIRFVEELYFRPNTLNNEGLFQHHLNLEIEGILTELSNNRVYWEEQSTRNDRRYQLINALLTIRPLFQEAMGRELHKKKLKQTISSFHSSKISEHAQNSILDDFIHYENHKDFESQEFYKLKIKDALMKEVIDQDVDPLLAANRLICELSKVEPPIHSAKQRRHSEPNPLVNKLPSSAALRRHSLPVKYPPYPPQNFVPYGQAITMIPGPSGPLRYPSPLSTSLPAPRPERTPEFRQSLPLQFPPQHESQLQVYYRSSAMDVRPFPLPPPSFNSTNDSFTYQSPARVPQDIRTPENQENLYNRDFAERSFRGNEQIIDHQIPPQQSSGPQILNRSPDNQQNLSVREFAERSFRGNEQIVVHQIPLQQSPIRGPQTLHLRPDNRQHVSIRELAEPTEPEQIEDQQFGARVRTAAQARTGPRCSIECPLDRQARGRHVVDEGYCETCDRDDDCYYNVPCHPHMHYMCRYF